MWEARMRMDEVKGGVKVFSAGGGDEPADEEGMRVYRRLRRNQSDGNAGAGNGAAAAAKKRRNWKASEPVTAIGDLRKSHSDAMAAVSTTTTTTTAVVARRAVARVTTPEKKIAPAAAASGEVKEVVVVDVHKAQAEEEPEEELDDDAYGLDDEELEAEEEEKEMLDQDHMAVDKDETALHQGKESVAAPLLLLLPDLFLDQLMRLCSSIVPRLQWTMTTTKISSHRQKVRRKFRTTFSQIVVLVFQWRHSC